MAVQRHPVLVLSGETGSGKTTQLPKMCLAAGRGTAGRIACTQPRRVAALSISRRVAEELGVPWGREVGCKIRFGDHTSSQTIIKYLTDGMLLAEVQGDPMLREYDTIIIDEAHERSLNIDFLLGHLRQLRARRPDLRIVITSATIDTEVFSKAFDGAPVIEVTGRLYPVELIYAPLDSLGSDAAADDEPVARAEALHYIDGAVEAVERIVRESPSGDVLVFLPAERDIRETRDLLDGRNLGGAEVVPLFGRLSNAEQQRVFAPAQRRKIVVATNIAETSLTIPGIRFVVDTGLARLSRYAPQARTRRLPIEPISQSSADQRKGRCGRVASGVCIRLYSEADYLDRPRFTQPEIQRANLAEVILRMEVGGLGDVDSFPFINAPPAKAVRAGYQLLEELGALVPRERDGEAAGGGAGPAWALTPTGRELARLPVDPTVGRMILQARTEKCLREVLAIAAGLSIQDPRERPLDRQAEADTAHRRFTHRDSDFLTLLNIWETLHAEIEALTQGRLRRFCREHFLSYIRVREWRDIHDQLVEVLEERDDFKLTSVRDGLAPRAERELKVDFGTPAYRAIHRSVLAGLLGNVAVFDDQSGLYKATHERKVALFPGSALHVKSAQKKPRGKDAGPAARGSRSPRWIMAAEMVETARLYARTAARIDPAWAVDLGAHLLKITHADPFWNAEAGRVLVKRRARLYGLELESRAVGYGKVNPVHATELFIREGLVGDTVTWPFDFLEHNRKVRSKVETILTRTRSRGYLNLDEAIYRFYAGRLLPAEGAAEGVSSVPELIDLVRERRAKEPSFLCFEAEDLQGAEEAEHDAEDFPDALPLANRVLPLDYAYRPGEEEDGVTLTVGLAAAAALTPAALDWAVPGHLEEKVLHFIKALPTAQRRTLIPLAEAARTAARAVARQARLRGHQDSLVATLSAHLREAHNLAVDPAAWEARPLPGHLRVRVCVVDDRGEPIAAGRDLGELRAAIEAHQRRLSAAAPSEEPGAWREARARWEKAAREAWAFGDLPEQVKVTDQAGVPVYAYPALMPVDAGVAVRLLRSPEEARSVCARGLFRLFQLQLRYELGWLERDLRAVREAGVLAAGFISVESLQAQSLDAVCRWACGRPVAPLTSAAFGAALDEARAGLRGLVPKLVDLLKEILELRLALVTHEKPYPGFADELASLLPPDFIATTGYDRLGALPRYLRAMKIRADRWRENPGRDSERTRELAPWIAAAAALPRGGLHAARAGHLRWLVEEYRVSLFAQELGTAEPVSRVKLEREFKAFRSEASAGGSPDTAGEPSAPRPAPPAAVAAPRKEPLKSLGALDRLFPKP